MLWTAPYREYVAPSWAYSFQEISRNFKKSKKSKKPHFSYNHGYNHRPSSADNFRVYYENTSEPKYGFVTIVSLVVDQPCTTNVNCLGGLNLRSPRNVPWGQTGGAPEANSTDSTNTNSRHKRQTGEEFFSSSPPDCRLTRREQEFCQP